MAERIEIEVEISPEGEVSLKVKGVKGKGCDAIAAPFEAALGAAAERRHTPEYFEAEVTASQTRRRT